MKRSLNLVVAALSLAIAAPAAGQTTGHAVAMGISGISVIAVQGTTALTIGAHKAGAPRVVATAAASYAITTNEENRQLVVSIDEPLPAGVTLTMNVAAPSGAVAYSVLLSTEAQTAVAGISRLNQSGLAITYSMTTAAGVRLPESVVRNVKMTIEPGVGPRQIAGSSESAPVVRDP